MDKHEFQIKTEQMGKLLKRGDYGTAAKIADSIDWRKVRNVGLLMEVAEAYENTERFEDCYEILNIAYDCAPIGRMIVYKMTEVAVKLQDFDEATDLYKEFVKIAPHDLARYVLKYKIYKGRGSSVEDQIAILEEYKSREYQEQWAYELAELYYKQGMLSKCVEECDDLILWFSEGEYVVKAMELKMRIQPLTASQETKYRQMVTEAKAEEIQVKPVNMEQFNTMNLQAALAESLQDFMKEDEGQQEEEPLEAEPEQEVRGAEQDIRESEQDIREVEQDVREPEQESRKREQDPWESVQDILEEAELPDKSEGSQGTEAEKKLPTEPVKTYDSAAKTARRETMPIPRFLGENESGQLTFDMEENVLERQITGQMSIEDIMIGWEAKKRETEAAIAEAAKRDEARRKEREHLRATGQLPDLKAEVKSTVPEEIQRLIEEIEGRIPVKIHVEPIERTSAGESASKEPVSKESASREPEKKETQPKTQTKAAATEKEPEEILDILEEPVLPEAKETASLSDVSAGPQEILAILEDPVETETEKKTEQPAEAAKQAERPAAAAEKAKRLAVAAEKMERPARTEQKAEQPQERTQKAEQAAPSPMLEKLEKSLEETLSALPPGQLSDDQKKLFAYFTSVRGMNKQLAELLEEDRMRRERREDSLVGNIVVTGERGTGKSTLAADIVKALQKQRRIKGAKMAKLSADSIDGKNISAIFAKLGGGALLIERAGNMKTETAVQLSHAMTRKTGGLLVILEDEKEEIRRLFIRCESLGAKFTRTIEIPVFTNKELVAFGESYAQEQECVLDEMAVLALYNRIGNNQTSDHLVNVTEVKEMVDEAIDRGGKKGLFGKVRKSRLDEFGHLILLEKDFEK